MVQHLHLLLNCTVHPFRSDLVKNRSTQRMEHLESYKGEVSTQKSVPQLVRRSPHASNKLQSLVDKKLCPFYSFLRNQPTGLIMFDSVLSLRRYVISLRIKHQGLFCYTKLSTLVMYLAEIRTFISLGVPWTVGRPGNDDETPACLSLLVPIPNILIPFH